MPFIIIVEIIKNKRKRKTNIENVFNTWCEAAIYAIELYRTYCLDIKGDYPNYDVGDIIRSLMVHNVRPIHEMISYLYQEINDYKVHINEVI